MEWNGMEWNGMEWNGIWLTPCRHFKLYPSHLHRFFRSFVSCSFARTLTPHSPTCMRFNFFNSRHRFSRNRFHAFRCWSLYKLIFHVQYKSPNFLCPRLGPDFQLGDCQNSAIAPPRHLPVETLDHKTETYNFLTLFQFVNNSEIVK